MCQALAQYPSAHIHRVGGDSKQGNKCEMTLCPYSGNQPVRQNLSHKHGNNCLRVLAHRKYRCPRSCQYLINHIFGARITLILLFAILFY